MYCNYCGKEINKDSSFCIHCGNHVYDYLVLNEKEESTTKHGLVMSIIGLVLACFGTMLIACYLIVMLFLGILAFSASADDIELMLFKMFLYFLTFAAIFIIPSIVLAINGILKSRTEGRKPGVILGCVALGLNAESIILYLFIALMILGGI